MPFSRPMPARPGSLAAGAVEDLRLLLQFMEGRDAAFDRAFGHRIRRSALADQIIRQMVLAFGDGGTLPLSAYVKACAGFASANRVRDKVMTLMVAGVLIIEDSASDRRERRLVPTVSTIEFYSYEMPRLRDEAARLLCRPTN